LSAIAFPLLQNQETGNANTFFVVAAGLNFVAIAAWCAMNPNRVSDKKLSPAAIRRRFIAMLTGLFVLTAAAVGFKIYRSLDKKPTPVVEPNQTDANEVTDANQP